MKLTDRLTPETDFTFGIPDLRTLARSLERQRDHAVEALKKLSCLGNGGSPGNSDGNCIAQKALSEIEAAGSEG